MFKDKNFKKYLWIYLGITFGLSWGISLLYVLCYKQLSPIFGKLNMSSPLVVIALNSPSIAGVFVYYMYGGKKSLLQFFKRLIPNLRECRWFIYLFIVSIAFFAAMHYGSILLHIPLPKVKLSTNDRLVLLLKNIYEETGLLGGALGWYGFLLPYMQKQYYSSIKGGLMTGFIFGLFVFPGYALSSFETATTYPFYVLQLMLFSVFIAFVMNQTRGNVLFFVFCFWLVASGSKLQFYNFIAGVQILEIGFFLITVIGMYLYYRIVKNKDLNTYSLCLFPDFIGN
ncbi:hypothetical protein ACVR0A_08840 [Streptococcus downei]|uniref:Uncharacterized protein n=1 Tax=Streptococcus downei MFe28 TaxID=764290 RepID=A0A380JBB1_STRDO|nr:hypothetical protein [Streptococcus downei]SUN35301.1 Uncharacterised protein [Streptococcus downei MFe28]